jgi:predicted NAD/FAD-binding protein
MRSKIAIVGSGISGLSAAYALRKSADVTLYEADSRLGGHSNTVDVQLGDWTGPVDTGFIVFNHANYPNLCGLFDALDVPTKPAEMHFSVGIGGGKREFTGRDLLAGAKNWTSPRHWKMVRQALRFIDVGNRLHGDKVDPTLTVGDFLDAHDLNSPFAEDFLLPSSAAIWSSSTEGFRDFPLATFLRFFKNHGLMQRGQIVQWYTVDGGSREYVNRIVQALGPGRVRPGSPVVELERGPNTVKLRTADGHEDIFDDVILATHSDQALKILGDGASEAEIATLSNLKYQANRAVLHTDTRQMPKDRSIWGAWNYLSRDFGQTSSRVAVTYYMNDLQSIDSPEPIFVTLNPYEEIDPAKVIQTFDYDHPLFDQAALDAQAKLADIQGINRTWFAGAYAGYGFHEDGCQAGLSVAAALGARVPWTKDIVPMSASVRCVDMARAVQLQFERLGPLSEIDAQRVAAE